MKSKGFTFIELVIVIAIISILASIVLMSIKGSQEKAYLARAQKELEAVATALVIYRDNNLGQYPADVNRDIPPGLEEYLGPGEWPEAPWPGSIYDWDNWTDPATGEKIYQVSIRFCPLGDPAGCRFPNQPWAEDFDYYSSAYYCVFGLCRSHIDKPVDHPGYRINF